jgi:uncharacterized protein (DUF342 family)
MQPDVNTTSKLRVVISDDRLQAWLLLTDRLSPQFVPPTEAGIQAALTAARIALTDDAQQHIAELLGIIAGGGGDGAAEIPEKFLIATGRAAQEAVDGRFEWYPDFHVTPPDVDSDERIDYYSRCSIITVNAETAVGRLHPPVDGANGVDVHGADVRPRKPRGLRIELGNGLTTAPADPQEIVTTVAGRVVLNHHKLRVEEVLQVPGDVDFDTGNIESTVNIEIRGAVRANFRVHTTKSLVAGGTIEAAQVEADGDVTCLKGLVGNQGKGLVRAGGIVTARFINEANVTATGGIRVARSMVGAQVHTDGDLLIENGAVLGGNTYARQGITARTLGSDACVRTAVAVGIHPRQALQLREIDERIKEWQKLTDQIRARVQPLLAQLKRLTPAQRERATELLSKADELELQIGDAQTQRQALLDQMATPEPPRVIVNREIYPGVRIAIGLREVVFDKLNHGPLVIEERKVSGATEIVAVSRRTGSVTVLRARELDLTPYQETAPDTGGAHANVAESRNEPPA